MEKVVLPNAQEIVRRLTKVNDNAIMREIYSSIAKEENRELTAPGIVLTLTQIVNDHVKGGEMATLVHDLTPVWIDALVENNVVANEAKALFQKAKETTSQEDVSLGPPITSQRQALRYLANWMRQQGYEGVVRIWQAYGQRQDKTGTYFDFDVMTPQGVFLVYEDGTVKDSYGALAKKS